MRQDSEYQDREVIDALLARRECRLRMYVGTSLAKEWWPAEYGDLHVEISVGLEQRWVWLTEQFRCFAEGGFAPLTEPYTEHCVFVKWGNVMEDHKEFTIEMVKAPAPAQA